MPIYMVISMVISHSAWGATWQSKKTMTSPVARPAPRQRLQWGIAICHSWIDGRS